MSLSHSLTMRMDQRQVLTPRMIQSMEILQLPLAALEERIDQELQVNPTLEVLSRDVDAHRGSTTDSADPPERTEGEVRLDVNAQSPDAAEFNRLERMADYLENEEYSSNNSGHRPSHWEGQDRDAKLDALANTAARGGTIGEHLLSQWRFVEAPPKVKRAGEKLIDYIDADGYMRSPLHHVVLEAGEPVATDDLEAALLLIQTLDPPGVGARDLSECMVLQLQALERDEEMAEGHDFPLEKTLVRNHLNDLAQNRYPQISRRLGRSIDEIKAAVRRLSRLLPHPGKQFSTDVAPPVTPDALIYLDESTGRYEIKMSRDIAPSLRLKKMYLKMLRDKLDRKTKDFLNTNVRNAKWLMEAIEQRRGTIERVIRVVVDTQQEFFEKGPEALKPLPMTGVADQLGIHVATVSRAVSEKYIQTPRGVFPLRRFFSGGTQSASGEEMSWDAVKEKLRILIDNEDKDYPMSDDAIVTALTAQGIDIARRTVAKYRSIMNIPTARQRKAY